MEKPELLSPVGSKEALKAAIMGGCDAVYLGGYTFGARSFAQNFSLEEIKEAIEYAHLYGVKVYITTNTLIFENEVENFLEYIEYIHKCNVDAVIMQDLGMIDLVRKTFPNLVIHASTQMHIHNLNGVKLLEELGIKRVVLARETPIDLVKQIKENTSIELEIFVHGALCVSYSGQCLMSSLIGGRSGNRGTCTQCCRMPYDLYCDSKKFNVDKYLLSTKDLNTILHIGELITSGVESFKIEGRMKRPEYVYLVTSIYRKAIDNYVEFGKTNITNEDIKNLEKIFNRKFTKGYLFNEKNNEIINQYRPNHLGVEVGKVISTKDNLVTIKLTDSIKQTDGIRIISTEDTGCILNKIYMNSKLVNKGNSGEIISINIDSKVNIGDLVVKTTDAEQLKQINNLISLNSRKVNVDIVIECFINKPIVLTICDGTNNIKLESEYLCEKANNSGTTKDRIKSQISKLGDYIYKANNVNVISDDNVYVRIDEINKIKRQIIELLNNTRIYKLPFERKIYEIEPMEFIENKGYNYLVHNKKEYELIKNKDCKEIYADSIYENNNKLVLKLPRVLLEYEKLNTKVLVGELGSLYKCNDSYTDTSLNVTNSYTVAFLHSIGVRRITLSVELSYKQIEEIIYSYKERYHKLPNLELIVESKLEAMVTKFNLLDYYKVKGNNNYLKDSKDRIFKVINNGMTIIYDYKKTIRSEHDYYFNLGINTLRIEVFD
ncbi:MAG: DUF3656 domain-containing protein [Bacilli bacterium]